ncbi:MAG: Hsp20/alpha crystallin family protein [Lachnospiraceae bacterium]|nr:Hsp20/alpha crystallin family protein [Lachnospiraceae bacterium]
MYRPAIYRNGLFDDFFDFSFPETRSFKSEKTFDIMKTDIKENESGYEAMIDIPGYGKDEIQITLEKGNLTVSASKNNETEEKDEKSGYIRRERFSGSMQRTFYVGENLTEKDIHASFENGVLKLSIPKITAKPEETKKLISID